MKITLQYNTNSGKYSMTHHEGFLTDTYRYNVTTCLFVCTKTARVLHEEDCTKPTWKCLVLIAKTLELQFK